MRERERERGENQQKFETRVKKKRGERKSSTDIKRI